MSNVLVTINDNFQETCLSMCVDVYVNTCVRVGEGVTLPISRPLIMAQRLICLRLFLPFPQRLQFKGSAEEKKKQISLVPETTRSSSSNHSLLYISVMSVTCPAHNAHALNISHIISHYYMSTKISFFQLYSRKYLITTVPKQPAETQLLTVLFPPVLK